MKEECNAFRALAKSLWAQGEDGEVIARDLTHALKYVIEEGIGTGSETFIEEVKRLLNE